jgi:hypothetical protein
MRTPLAVAAVVVLLASSVLAASSAAAEPTTDGHIVWTKRIADGREALLIADADGTDQRVLVPAAKGEVNVGLGSLRRSHIRDSNGGRPR